MATSLKTERHLDDGYTYEKHKIFLYKEDFNKFIKAFNTTVDYVKDELLPEVDFDKFDRERVASLKANDIGSKSEVDNVESTEPESESTTESDSEAVEEPDDNATVENELKWD